MHIPHIQRPGARLARSRGLLAIAVACSLVLALRSVAEARPKSPPRAHHVDVPGSARQGDYAFAGASVPRELRGVEPVAEDRQNRMVLASDEAAPAPPTGDGRSPAIEVIAVPPPADVLTLTFVDPAGGHARVLPIETANPYRAR